MGFGCEVDDAIRLEVLDYCFHGCSIGDVALNKLIAGVVCHGDQVIQVASVGEFVKVENVIVGFGDLLEDEVASYEAGV